MLLTPVHELDETSYELAKSPPGEGPTRKYLPRLLRVPNLFQSAEILMVTKAVFMVSLGHLRLFSTLDGLTDIQALFKRSSPRPAETQVDQYVATLPLEVIRIERVQPAAGEVFVVLAKWEGVVLEVRGGTFRARLADVISPSLDEIAEFPLEELAPSDREQVSPGSCFDWTVGYSDTPTGRERVSVIRFREQSIWTEEEVRQIEDAAESHSEYIEHD